MNKWHRDSGGRGGAQEGVGSVVHPEKHTAAPDDGQEGGGQKNAEERGGEGGNKNRPATHCSRCRSRAGMQAGRHAGRRAGGVLPSLLASSPPSSALVTATRLGWVCEQDLCLWICRHIKFCLISSGGDGGIIASLQHACHLRRRRRRLNIEIDEWASKRACERVSQREAEAHTDGRPSSHCAILQSYCRLCRLLCYRHRDPGPAAPPEGRESLLISGRWSMVPPSLPLISSLSPLMEI